MKLSLVVLTPGKLEGKVIPVSLAQFVIGRDPQCHLRPANPIISKRHCAIVIQNGKAILRDFNSTNGTFLNKEQITGDRELNNGDEINIGPLTFGVRLEVGTAVDKPTPVPPTKTNSKHEEDEAAAAMLLSTPTDDTASATGGQEIPGGSTILELAAVNQDTEANPAGTGSKEEKTKYDKAKEAQADTSIAAKAILNKYMRRSRT
jgi:pSer/pThr/pTyr-binding forkhead associated (FHA) protein